MMEQAGGRAVDGTDRILDIVPESIHQRSGLIVGGTEDVDNYLSSIRR